jgi:hypothetical protein
MARIVVVGTVLDPRLLLVAGAPALLFQAFRAGINCCGAGGGGMLILCGFPFPTVAEVVALGILNGASGIGDTFLAGF